MSNLTKDEAVSQAAYNFPVFPVETSSNREGETEQKDDFQRIAIGKNGKLSIDGAEIRAARIEKNAYIQGFSKGERDGIESGKKNFEPVLKSFRDALSELVEVRKEIYLNAEKDIVDLVLAIARKIVCDELASNNEVVLRIVKEGLKKVVDREGIKIRVSPSDLQFVKNAGTELSHLVDNIQGLTFVEDETILHGGCVIETNSGDIDARIEKQIEAVEEALKSEFQE